MFGQLNLYWRGENTDGNWAGPSKWYKTDAPAGSVAALGLENLYFDNDNQTTMTNNLTGDAASRHRIYFNSGANNTRTISGNTTNSFNLFGSNLPFIQNNSSAAHVLNFPMSISSSSGMEINPVSGNLTIGGSLDNNGNAIFIKGDNSKVLTFSSNAVISGSGKLNILEYSLVKLQSPSTFTGNLEIDKGEFWLEQGGTLGSGSVFIGNSSQAANVSKLWISDLDGGTSLSRSIQVNQGNL